MYFKQVPQRTSGLDLEVHKSLCNGPVCKYFRFCGSEDLSQLLNSAIEQKQLRQYLTE